MFTRRSLLKRSAILSLAPTVPGFLSRTAMAAQPERDGRILVVVQLYLTFVVAANLLVSDYLWAGFFFLAGLVNLWAIHRGLSPKEPQHG